MAKSINRAQLIGNLGKDPEIRTTQDGNRIATFSIATSQQWKDKQTGEKKEVTQWHRIVVFVDAIAGLCEQYLRKGSRVLIEGQMETRPYDDEHGTKRYITEVVVRQRSGQLILLNDNAPESTSDTEDALDDEIPY